MMMMMYDYGYDDCDLDCGAFLARVFFFLDVPYIYSQCRSERVFGLEIQQKPSWHILERLPVNTLHSFPKSRTS
jgi:hypothetical protein